MASCSFAAYRSVRPERKGRATLPRLCAACRAPLVFFTDAIGRLLEQCPACKHVAPVTDAGAARLALVGPPTGDPVPSAEPEPRPYDPEADQLRRRGEHSHGGPRRRVWTPVSAEDVRRERARRAPWLNPLWAAARPASATVRPNPHPAACPVCHRFMGRAGCATCGSVRREAA